MDQEELEEKVLSGWIILNSRLKDSRVTRDMSYNEAIVMRIVLENYRKDGVGLTPVRQILKETRILKSQMNRTLNLLCEKGYLEKRRDSRDARSLYVTPRPEKLPDFLEVHNSSLSLVRRVIEIIGPEDAAHFIRVCEKVGAAEIELP